MGKIVSITKNGKRYDIPLNKQEPIATDEPVISRGAIVSKDGHTGKVLETEGDMASVSWEDASISKLPIKDLKYEGRVEKAWTPEAREAALEARRGSAGSPPSKKDDAKWKSFFSHPKFGEKRWKLYQQGKIKGPK